MEFCEVDGGDLSDFDLEDGDRSSAVGMNVLRKSNLLPMCSVEYKNSASSIGCDQSEQRR